MGVLARWWVLLLLVAIPAVAGADRKLASQYFKAGQQAYESKDFLTAIRAFERSYAEQPHAALLFATAQAYRRQFEIDHDLAKLRRAIDRYRRFVKAAPRSPYRLTADSELIQLLAILARQPKEPASQPAPAPPPPPKTTQLMVTTETPGARIQLDGAPQGGQPSPAVRVVAPGAHTVRITAPGFAPAERTATAVKERLVLLALDLEPLPGELRVLSNVDGATVFVDGRGVGRTPFLQGGFAVGPRAVAVGHRGHRLWSDEVQVRSGATAVAVANLEWSLQRKLALSTAAGGALLGTAGLITGLVALQADSNLDSLPTETNAEREAYNDRLAGRDRLATASTALLSVAAAAAVTAALLYWFDRPEAPLVTTGGKHAVRVGF